MPGPARPLAVPWAVRPGRIAGAMPFPSALQGNPAAGLGGTASLTGAGTLTAPAILRPATGIAGAGSLTAAPVRPGQALAAVTVYGAAGTFGSIAGLAATSTGQTLACAPVPGWQFGAGAAVFYTRATPDGQVIMSTLPFTNNELQPTADHAEMCTFDPAAQAFRRQVIPTSAGQLTAVNPSTGLGGTDTGAGDIALVTGLDGVQRILTTQGGYYFGWAQPAGLYPALAYFQPGAGGQWDYAPARSLTGDQWEATNPGLFSSVMAPAGQAAGNGFSYWSPRTVGQMAVLPDGNVVIGHYFGFGGAGSVSGGLSVITPDGNLLAAYQLPNITPTAGTMTFCAVRDVEADPTSDPDGLQYFCVIFDPFGTGLRHTFQMYSYDHAAQVIAPVTVPVCPGDDTVAPSFAIFDANGALYITCGSGLTGLASLAAGNTQVYYKAGGTWKPVTQAPAFPGWQASSWPTPVTADQSLGFPVAFGLGALGGPAVIDPQSGSLLIPSPGTNLGISVPQGGGNGPNLLSTFASALTPPQLLSTNDATFATGLGTWTAFDGTATYDAFPPVPPPAVGSLPGAGAMQMDQFGGGSAYSTGRYAAVPSTPYQFTVSFLSASTARACGIFVQWYDGTVTLIATSSTTTVTDSATAWTACTLPPQTSPPSAATYAIFAEVLSQGAEHHYLAGNSAYNVSAAAAGWTGFFTTLQLAQLADGTWALAMTAQLNNETMSATQPGVAVVPYQEYVLSCQFRAAATPEPCTAVIIWKNAGGGTISTSPVTMSATDATTGLVTAQCSAMAPPGAATAVVQPEAFAASAGETHYVTNIIFCTQPWQALPAIDYEIAGISAAYGTAGCGRGCVIGGVFYIPVQTTFTAAEQAAYNAGGYVPGFKPQFLIAVDLRQVIPADDPSPYVAGQAAESYPVTGMPSPGAQSLMVPVTMRAPGDWLIAVISWRQPGYGPPVHVCVEDDAAGGRNWWDPLQPGADSDAAGFVRAAIWAAPAARIPEHVMIAPTGYAAAIAATVIGVPSALIGPWISALPVASTWGNGVSSLPPVATGAPPGPCLMITGCGGDVADTALSITGAWTALPQEGATNGADRTTDITIGAAWQVTTGPASAAWSASSGQDLAAAITGVLLAAPPPADVTLPGEPGTGVTWPGGLRAQLAIGSGAGTPPSQLAWTPVTARSLAARFSQGRQYTLGQLRAGQGWLSLDNPDLALIPPGTGPFAGIDSGTPFRILLIFPASPTPYYVWAAGYVQRWPPAWDPGTLRGLTTATLTDTWGYANKLLKSIARTETLADQPVLYAPCGDAAGSAAASNIAPGGQPPLAVMSSKYGTSAATQQFGAQAVPTLLGDVTTTITASGLASTGGGAWQQVLANPTAGITGGWSLGCAGQFPPVSGGLTAEFWFQVQAPVQQQGTLLLAWCKSPPPFSAGYPRGVLIWVDTPPAQGGTGKLTLFTSWTAPAAIARIGTGGTDYTAGAVPPLTHVAITFNAATWTTYVNGVRTATGTWGSNLGGSLPYVSVNGATALPWPIPGLGSLTASSYSGLTAHVALYKGILPAGRILSHYYAGLGYAGETASRRIERLMQAAGVTGRRLILPDTGAWKAPAASCQDIGGQPAAASLTNMAQSTTPAVLAIAPTGAPFYLARQYAYNQPVTWVLGDDADAGEYPFLPGFAPDYDPVRVVNDIQVTQLDDQSASVPQLASQEAASQAQYGPQSAGGQLTGYLQDDALSPPGAGPGCQDLANWIADVSTRPRLRIAQVTVDAAAHPAAWPFAAGVTCGDMITCNFRPPTAPAGSLVTVTGRVTSTDRALQFDLDKVTGSVTCVIDVAPEMAVLTAGDPVLGQLDGTNPMAW